MKKIPLKKIERFVLGTFIPRAIEIIRGEIEEMTIKEKVGYDGIKPDFATSADLKVQAFAIPLMMELFPEFGIIAEENYSEDDDTESFKNYITLDPLDGTKAFVRNSSTGVGSMIAFVCNNEIVASYIADINTGHIYGQTGNETFWIRFGKRINLKPNTDKSLCTQYLVAREQPRKMPAVFTQMCEEQNAGGLFKDFEIQSGSVGLLFARLWRGEVGGIVLPTHHITPWDETPLLGICKQIDCIFLYWDEQKGCFVEFTPTPSRKIVHSNHNMIILHKSMLPEFNDWQKLNGLI